LNDLEFYGFELKHSKPRVRVLIKENEVFFEVDSSVVIEKEGKTTVFDTKEHPVIQLFALNNILDVAEYITDSHKIDSKMYCISCLEERAEEKEVYIKYITFPENSILVILEENKTSNEPYLFSFLNKYTGKEVSDNFVLSGEFVDELPGGLNV